MKYMDDFCYTKEITTKLTLSTVSKYEWNTKEGTCKSMKNASDIKQQKSNLYR